MAHARTCGSPAGWRGSAEDVPEREAGHGLVVAQVLAGSVWPTNLDRGVFYRQRFARRAIGFLSHDLDHDHLLHFDGGLDALAIPHRSAGESEIGAIVRSVADREPPGGRAGGVERDPVHPRRSDRQVVGCRVAGDVVAGRACQTGAGGSG